VCRSRQRGEGKGLYGRLTTIGRAKIGNAKFSGGWMGGGGERDFGREESVQLTPCTRT